MRVLGKENIKMSIKETFLKILKTEGVPGLYKGLIATYIKVIPMTAIAFTAND